MKKTNLFALFLALFLTGYFTFIGFRYPLIGLEVEKKQSDWIVTSKMDKGWSSTQPIEEGNIIKLVNGQEVEKHPTLKKFSMIEMADTITVENQDSEMKTYSVTTNSNGTSYLFYLLFPLFFNVITIGLSVLLYYKARNNQPATILMFFLLSLGICYLGAYASTLGDSIGRIVTTVTLPSTVILLIHFLQIYFLKYDMTLMKKKVSKYLYVITLVVVSSLVGTELMATNLVTREFELFYFLLLIVLLSYYVIKLLIRYKNSTMATIIKILGVSFFLAFSPFIILYLIPELWLGYAIISAEVASSFLIIIPISLVYLLLAEKLFDIAFIMGRLRYYVLLAFPFAAIGVVISSFFSQQIQLTNSFTIILFLVFFVGVILLLYIKEYLDYKIKHHLFSQKGNLEMSLYNFFQKAKHETKVSSLVHYLQNEIKEVLGVKDVLYSELYTEDEGTIWAIRNDGNYPLRHILKVKEVNWIRCGIGTLIEVNDGFGIVIGGDHNHKKVILFGMKDSKTNLNIQEKIWLETLVYFSSILLENFELIEGLVDKIEDYKEKSNHPLWLSRLLFSLAEKERTNLSIDLHDSVLQDQLQLLREVEQMAMKATSPELKNDLSNIQESMLDNIHLVRETCNELQPPFLSEIGVIQSIQNLVDQTNLRCSFILTSELDPSIQWLDKEVELALYRVVQELLNNAMEHSQATKVELTLRKNDQSLSLIYHDDGVGFDMAVLNDSFKTMGVFGVKERVRSLGGTIEIDSALGQGMSAQIEFKEGDHKHD